MFKMHDVDSNACSLKYMSEKVVDWGVKNQTKQTKLFKMLDVNKKRHVV